MTQKIILLLLFTWLLKSGDAQSWSLTGNSGISVGTNFLGTTNGASLAIRTVNIERMRINTIGRVGIGTPSPLTLLHVNGDINFPSRSGLFIQGKKTLKTNPTAFNYVFGDSALSRDTGSSIAGGTKSIAIGFAALKTQTFSISSADGTQNIAIGNEAMKFNTLSSNNIAIGHQAMLHPSGAGTGGNVAIGTSAMPKGGIFQTAIGNFTMQSIDQTGIGNTALGNGADILKAGAFGTSNATAIGAGAVSDASNKIRLGNTSVTSIGGQVSYTTFSDSRFKQNIKEETHGLDFIKLLQPVSYNYDINGIEDFWSAKGAEEAKANAEIQKNKTAQIKNRYTGFLAQDVYKAAQSINYSFSGIDKPADDTKSTWGLRYSDFVVPLVKAVQELSVKNDELQMTNDELKKSVSSQQKINDALQQQINELKAMIVSGQSPANNQQSTVISSALLQQNIPNPFSNNTTISYALPQKFTAAQITITDKNGKTIKVASISGSGKGSLNVDASTLASGAYNYSLYVDGRLIDTKQMVLQK